MYELLISLHEMWKIYQLQFWVKDEAGYVHNNGTWKYVYSDINSEY